MGGMQQTPEMPRALVGCHSRACKCTAWQWPHAHQPDASTHTVRLPLAFPQVSRQARCAAGGSTSAVLTAQVRPPSRIGSGELLDGYGCCARSLAPSIAARVSTPAGFSSLPSCEQLRCLTTLSPSWPPFPQPRLRSNGSQGGMRRPRGGPHSLLAACTGCVALAA